MMYSVSVHICILLFIGNVKGLEKLPPVDDNNILTTEAVIRETFNKLFTALRIGDIRKNPRLIEYSTVHKHLITYTVTDYSNLKEIAKLTRVVNGTEGKIEYFIATLTELLDADTNIENKDTTKDIDIKEDVVGYFNIFLENLECLKDEFGVTHDKFHLNKDIYDILKDHNLWNSNDTETNHTAFGEMDFWKPDDISSGRRIFTGKKTKVKYFPFMASIHIFNKFHCGGSIIKSDLIISAASCMQLAWNNRFFRENPAFLSVRVGSDFYNLGGEVIPVLEVYFHPSYDPKTLRNNICVLRLLRKLNFRNRSKRIKKINIDRKYSRLPANTPGITILGWGARWLSNIVSKPWINRLAYAILDFYPLHECQEIYSKEYVSQKNFCAGFMSKGGGACHGDVGGPGVAGRTLVGVVSFGSPVCGTPDAPTVFTKVGYYADWIKEIMNQDVPTGRVRTTLKPARIFNDPRIFKFLSSIRPSMPSYANETLYDDILRLSEDSERFQDFTNTIFEPKEIFDEPKPDIKHESSLDISADKIPVTEIMADLLESKERIDIEETDFVQVYTTAMIPYDPHEKYTYRATKSVQRGHPLIRNNKKVNEKDLELERELINLIDTIDLKQLIQNVTSLEDIELFQDPKLLDLLASKTSKRMGNVDDSILTLLYLLNKEKSELTNDMDNVLSSSSSSADDSDEEKGINIAYNGLSDMAL